MTLLYLRITLDSTGGQEALFAQIANSEHASKAQAMILFGLRKGSFNGLLAPVVQAPAIGRFRKRRNGVQIILPYMSRHQPSLCTRAQALASPRTVCTLLCTAVIFTEAVAVGGFPV